MWSDKWLEFSVLGGSSIAYPIEYTPNSEPFKYNACLFTHRKSIDMEYTNVSKWL